MFTNMKKLSAIFLALLLGLSTMMTVSAEGEIPEGKVLKEEIEESVKKETVGQSGDVTVKAGETAVFTVPANVLVRSYQWQVSKNNGRKWSNVNSWASGKSNVLSFTAKKEYDGYLFRCAMAVKSFKVSYSKAVKLTVLEDMPAQSFGAADGSLNVEAPEGAFPEGTELSTETPDAKEVEAVLESTGVEGDVLYAVDFNFTDEAGEKLQPAVPVTVSFDAEPGLDPEKLALYHIDANADELDRKGLVAEEIGFTYDAVTGKVTFEAAKFSTYSLVWTEGGVEMGATIIWGYMNGTEFVELEEGSTVTLDTTAATVSLANTIEGYAYRDAVYCTAGQTITQGVDIGSVLHKTETGGWKVDVITTGEDDKPVVTPTAIADGSTIYAVYYVPGQPNPSGSLMPSVPSPATQKTVTPNGDGTYTIQLDVTGATVQQDESHYVNVLIILDATTSMSGAKWTNAKAAMRTLIETLCEGENAANAGKIDFALVTFGRSATVVSGWTKDNATFKTTCNGINMVSTSGTNWEAGMRGGLYGVLNTYPEGENAENHDPTYVIFLTDGDPNTYYWTNDDIGTTYRYQNRNYTVTATDVGAPTIFTNDHMRLGYQGSSATSANRSKDEAKAIAASTLLYGIYCGDSGNTPSGASFDRLVDVIQGTGQGGQDTIAANADTIEEEFKKIAETALKNMGPSNISVDDGIPGLSSISANVAGEAGGYEYYKSTDGETFTEWPEAPGAVYSSENGVTWDLSEAGVVQAGTTYRIKFTVWPSQEAYDLLADLNNGIQKLPLSDDKMVQLVVDIGNNRYTYTPGATEGAGVWNGTSGSPLTTEQLVAAIKAAEDAGTDVTYSVPTNTHLRTSYSFDGTTYTDIPAGALPSEDMLLEDTTIKVLKIWNNPVDTRAASILYQTDEEGEPILDEQGNKIPVTWVNPETGKEEIVYYGILKVTRDGELYMDNVIVRSDKGWISDDIFISCGVITKTTSGGVTTVSVKEAGHEYTVIEPDSYSYYWNLTADVYRPMVINGKTALLVLETEKDTSGWTADYVNDGGEWYKIKGKYYKVVPGSSNVMTATNDRRSSFTLKKVVNGTAPKGTLFPFTATVTFPKATKEDNAVWFHVEKDGAYIYDITTNATAETNAWPDGAVYDEESGTITYTYNGKEYTAPVASVDNQTYYTGFYSLPFAANSSTAQITVSLEDGWEVLFSNIPSGTQVDISEDLSDLPLFVLEDVAAMFDSLDPEVDDVADVTEGDGAELTVDLENNKISGSMSLSNGVYRIDFINKPLYFFVYHSKDNTIERISVDDARVTSGANGYGFNIVNETKAGSLYGGYYKAYSSAGMTDAQIIAAEYTADSNGKFWFTDSAGTKYDASKAGVWVKEEAYTATVEKTGGGTGTAMTVVPGAIYYLKEVPNGYIRPYIHFTYDERAEGMPLKKLYVITAADDTNYASVGYVLGSAASGTASEKRSLAITIKKPDGTIDATLTAKSVFKAEQMAKYTDNDGTNPAALTRGYLHLNDLTNSIGTKFTFQPCWNTLDGVLVKGLTVRTVNNGTTKTTIGVEDVAAP